MKNIQIDHSNKLNKLCKSKHKFSQFLLQLRTTFLNKLITKIPCFRNKVFQNGDLIFVEAGKGAFSRAIGKVTATNKNISYDHVGLLIKEHSQCFVIHASNKKGVIKQALNNFIKEYKKNQLRLVLYRLNKEYSHAIPAAIKKSKSLLGKPYNHTFLNNDAAFYCSNLIEVAFRKDSIFKVIPMEFHNPKTGEIDAYWIKYYKALKIEVPLGQPGTNPNQLSESKKIKKIKVF